MFLGEICQNVQKHKICSYQRTFYQLLWTCAEKPPGTYQSQISEEEASSSLEMHKKGKFTPFDLN